ncbi:cache domain-containing sensor histidine kinase [Paenibacillus sp. JDR-2]|uniref:cache domain-containing sensor histidine kinase n=1 Tax=Paenibacillus sp. (strain JDR-2) TaxID=324057 RepID=UPI000166A45D|nr:sensor histidine kinase [Paenibacillus sp. JDR-2]ACT00646.1 putative sensor with HAMP domain [Paenibacillus sp. JDR-2]
MGKWRNAWQSLFFKFALAFLVVGMIPLLVLSTLSLNQFTGQLQRHTENSFKQLVIHLSKNVDDALLNYNEISKTMYYSSEGVASRQDATLREEIDTEGKMNLMSIDDFLLSVLYSDSHIQNAFFVRASDGMVYHQSRVSSKVLDPNEPFPAVSWKFALSSTPKKLVVIPTHLETYYGSTDQVVTLARNLFDTSGKLGAEATLLGTLYFDIDLEIFDRLFRQAELSNNDQMVIVDGNGYILYSNQKDKLGKRLDENSARRNGEMLMFSEPIPFIGGQVIGLISKRDLYASLTPIRSTVIIVAAICMAALVVLGVLFSRRFSLPILDMMRLMIKVESGNLEPGPELKRKDELGRLWHGFNRMIARLQWFINDSYVNEIKRKQAELNALKSQIRPHYLYNTLEVIRMSAVSNGDDEVADMIHSLSNQLQYTIDYGEEWVTLEQEIKHVKHYFHLIEVRYDRRIELQIDIQDDLLREAQILKLSLQPVVENAILHGLRPLGNKGIVQITAERAQGGNLAVTVYDNGIGMDEETVARLNRQLQEAEGTSGKSIGFKNVHERVRHSCGDPYGIVIESKHQIGTAVLILYPLREKETEG